MLASTMQFSKFGQFPFEPTPAKYRTWWSAEKGPSKYGRPYLQDPTVCQCLIASFKSLHARVTPSSTRFKFGAFAPCQCSTLELSPPRRLRGMGLYTPKR